MVLVFHIAIMITASFLATATRALRNPILVASCRPQVRNELSVLIVRSSTVAAVIRCDLVSLFPYRLGRLCDQPASVAILPIVGEAMEPTLCNGDEVMISRVRFQESVREGLYAIRGSSEIFVRRIAIDPTKNRLTVLTDHPACPSWQGIQRKGVDFVGRVIWIGARVA